MHHIWQRILATAKNRSWWDGIDESGITPAILSSIGNDRTELGIFDVNDDYAENNPTVVIAPIANYQSLVFEDPSTGGNIGGSGSTNTTPRDINCNTLNTNDVLEMRMPQYRLHGNTRGWPSNNQLFLWTVVGNVSVASNGTVNISPDTDQIWDEKKVSRKNAKNQNWLNSDVSFIRSNWRQNQVGMRIIVAHRKSGNEVDIKSEVKVNTDAMGNTTSTTETTADFSVSEDKAKTMFNVEFDRCSTLSSIKTDGGFGLREDYRVHRFNNFSFYLKPVVR